MFWRPGYVTDCLVLLPCHNCDGKEDRASVSTVAGLTWQFKGKQPAFLHSVTACPNPASRAFNYR